MDELVVGLLGALARAAPRMHTLELIHASPAALRAVTDMLAGRTVFSLARLDVVSADMDADAAAALAAAVPASLRWLICDVRKTLRECEPLLAVLVAAAAARCPRLRVLRLAARRGDTSREVVLATGRRLLAHACAAAPHLLASLHVYGDMLRITEAARKSTHAGV